MLGSPVQARRSTDGPNGDEPLVWYQGGDLSTPHWLYADEKGSAIAQTDASGAIIAINSYNEFGINGAAHYGAFGYTGQHWIPEAGLYNYKARMYSPTLGRFMQTDPIGYGDGINIYNYTHSDPVNGSDPNGLANAQEQPPPKRNDPPPSPDFTVFGFPFYFRYFMAELGVGYRAEGDLRAANVGNGRADGGAPQSGPCGSHPILGAIGKVWNSPNSALGLAAAGASYLAGKWQGTNPSFQIGNNSIQLLNSPLNVNNRAYTLGNVQVYGVGDR